MIFFKKNTILLRDIITVDYIDIHSHILPGIDDGAKTLSDTIVLVEEMQNLGFSEIITTPHIIKNVWNNSKETIENSFGQVTDKLNFKITTAAEYMMDSYFMELIKTEKLLTLKENYVLVEMSYLNPPIQLYDILFELQVEGYKPILAHPERYNFFHGNLNEYKKLKNVGCLFQMNLLSSVGYYGKNVSKTADMLLKEKMIDFVGSDIHHINHVTSFDQKIILKNTLILKDVIHNNLFFKK